MRRLLPLCAALVAAALLAPAAPATAATRLTIKDGPTGRSELGGTWLRRGDRGDRGLARHWERSVSTSRWTRTRVPDAYDATSNSDDAYIGGPVWYRKDFRLPDAASGLEWRVRFQAVNHRATVWLNGRPIGEHTGGFLPFELPLDGVDRGGLNRLVVRVDNRRLPTDFPPSQYTETEEPRGGWWNYGGIVREVELRRIDRVDLARVKVTPLLGCAGCPATVAFRVTVANVSGARQRVRLRARIGDQPVAFRAVTVKPGRERIVSARAGVTSPHLWSPADPHLYPVAVEATAQARGERATPAAGYRLKLGLRSVAVRGGRLLLNGAPVDLRGVGLHEDLPGKGPALDQADRGALATQVRELGATLVRSHYPLHPAFQELADRMGLLIWSEVPVYRMRAEYLEDPAVRRAGVQELTEDILANENHPSVLLWSVGNELPGTNPPGIRSYIAAAAAQAKALDPSRPVGMAISGQPGVACAAGYEPLDVIGLNDYFGWYGGSIANREGLAAYLDTMRSCHPEQALMITEFGAEANRHGPVTEKGTYEFQQDFVRYHLGVYASRPWLSGAAYWALREFRCNPGWAGGNPRPQPPMHQKGLLTYAGQRKPAWADVQQAYRGVQQVPAAG